MKLRPIQLVCLALLLSTLRLTDPSVLATADFAMQGSYLRALFTQDYAAVWTGFATAEKLATRTRGIPAPATHERKLGLTAQFSAAANTPWTMRPPSAQCAALQSVTGFGRASA